MHLSGARARLTLCSIASSRSPLHSPPPPAGDLLRAEQARAGSQFGAMIKEYITEGKIVPMEVTIKLLENAMRAAMSSEAGEAKEAGASSGVKGIPARRFLVDGFPRQMDQAVKFDETVCPSSLVLFLVCPEAILQERLLERGKTSGRDDDNAASIKKRFGPSLSRLPRTVGPSSVGTAGRQRVAGGVVWRG